MQRRRDADASLKLLKGLLHNQPVEARVVVTDDLKSHPAALEELGLLHLHRPGRLREKNRAENSHLPIRRERKMQGLKTHASAQRFLTVHAAIYNTFYVQPHLIRRAALRLSAVRLVRRGRRLWPETADVLVTGNLVELSCQPCAAKSKRSAFMTLAQAATKSATNLA